MPDIPSVFERPLRICPGRSRRLGMAFALVHGGALLLVCLLPLPAAVSLLLAAVTVTAWRRAHRHHVLRADGAVRELLLRPDGVFEVTTAIGTGEASLLGAGVVQPWLTLLTLRLGDGRRLSVLLLPDNTEPHAFRRLRSRLKFMAGVMPVDPGAARDGGS